jgi:hypothetical protein
MIGAITESRLENHPLAVAMEKFSMNCLEVYDFVGLNPGNWSTIPPE